MESILPKLLGSFFIGAPIWRFVIQPYMTRSWPEVEARLVALDPVKERKLSPDGSDSSSENYVIQYFVDGELFTRSWGHELKFPALGSPIWRTIIVPYVFLLRHHPHDPKKVAIHHAVIPPFKVGLSLFSVLLGAFLLSL